MLNKNINNAKYDYVTRMEIKKDKNVLPKEALFISFGFQMIKLEEENRG